MQVILTNPHGSKPMHHGRVTMRKCMMRRMARHASYARHGLCIIGSSQKKATRASLDSKYCPASATTKCSEAASQWLPLGMLHIASTCHRQCIFNFRWLANKAHLRVRNTQDKGDELFLKRRGRQNEYGDSPPSAFRRKS